MNKRKQSKEKLFVLCFDLIWYQMEFNFSIYSLKMYNDDPYSKVQNQFLAINIELEISFIEKLSIRQVD